MNDIVIVSGVRTAVGSFGGSLKDISAQDLGALVIKEAVTRAGISPEAVDEVIIGQVGQIAEEGFGEDIFSFLLFCGLFSRIIPDSSRTTPAALSGSCSLRLKSAMACISSVSFSFSPLRAGSATGAVWVAGQGAATCGEEVTAGAAAFKSR